MPLARSRSESGTLSPPLRSAQTGALSLYLLESEQAAAGQITQAVINAMPVGLATLDLNCRFTMANPFFASVLGLRVEELPGRAAAEAMPSWLSSLTHAMERCLRDRLIGECEINLTPTGDARAFLCTLTPLYDDAGRELGMAATLIELASRGREETALKESEENYRCAVELNPHVLWTFDPVGEIFESSSRLPTLVDVPPGRVSRSSWLQAVDPEHVNQIVDAWTLSLETGQDYDREYRMRSPDGNYRWMRARASCRRDETGAIVRWYGILEDVEELRRTNQALREKTRRLELAGRQLAMLVREDYLTGLANRRHFDLTLEHEVRLAHRSGRPVALVMVDVDRFKRYNDLYGHVAGDACLRQAAAALGQITRNSQDLVARYGGEEFALILPNATEAQALQIAARAIERVRALMIEHTGNLPGRVTISAGVAALEPAQSRSDLHWAVSDLVRLADNALYAAKEGGRDRVVAGSTLAALNRGAQGTAEGQRSHDGAEMR